MIQKLKSMTLCQLNSQSQKKLIPNLELPTLGAIQIYTNERTVELGVRSLFSDDLFKTVQFDIRVRPYFIVKYSIQIQFYSRNIFTLIF